MSHASLDMTVLIELTALISSAWIFHESATSSWKMTEQAEISVSEDKISLEALAVSISGKHLADPCAMIANRVRNRIFCEGHIVVENSYPLSLFQNVLRFSLFKSGKTLFQCGEGPETSGSEVRSG